MSTPTAPSLDSAAILENARALSSAIRDAGDEIESSRQLPKALLDSLIAAGVFRIAMPHARGGPEMNPMQQIELIETLSRADASVGWCTCILSDGGFYAAFLDPDVALEIIPDLDDRVAGMLAPVGRAEVVDGGFRVTGRWAFGSGSLHATVITGGCLLTRNGVPELDEAGLPQWRIMVFPRSEVEILDTWFTTGLAGSGSNDYQVDDVFVPEANSFDVLAGAKRPEPLYRYHGLFFANLPGVPLGLGRAAIDHAIQVAETKLLTPSMQPLKNEYRMQVAVAEMEGELGAARSYVFDVLGDAWETLCRGDELQIAQRARIGLMIIHAGRTGRRVVERMCDEVGSSTIYTGHPLERLRRDAITVGSHIIHQAKTYQAVGQMLMGDTPPVAMF